MLQTARDSEAALRHQVAEAAVAAAAAQEADRSAAQAAAAAATAAAASSASRELLVEELSSLRAAHDTLREAYHRSDIPPTPSSLDNTSRSLLITLDGSLHC